MGLPRSRLVKPQSIEDIPPPPAHVMAPFAFVPVPVPAPESDGSEREAFRTKADSIEVEMSGEPEPIRGPYASAPSANELLERAAALGPARLTWESIVLPADPILDEKMQPRVAERRARLTRVVQIALAACLGVCVVALAVSAISAGSSPAAASAEPATIGKTIPSKSVVPIEPLDGTKHAKAPRNANVAPVATTAAIVRPMPKRR